MKIYFYEGKANLIGPRIKEARKALHYSQEDLAIRMQLSNIEISQKVISRIEKQERFVTDYEPVSYTHLLRHLTGNHIDDNHGGNHDHGQDRAVTAMFHLSGHHRFHMFVPS